MSHSIHTEPSASVSAVTDAKRRHAPSLATGAKPKGGRRVTDSAQCDGLPLSVVAGPSGRSQTDGGMDVSAATRLKPARLYAVAGRLRKTNAIYENELTFLLKRRKVLQLVIFMNPIGYTVAVLSKYRADDVTARYTRESDGVLRLRPVQIEHEGFAPLYSVRDQQVRSYRSVDTLINSLKRCGPLPPIYLRQGAKL